MRCVHHECAWTEKLCTLPISRQIAAAGTYRQHKSNSIGRNENTSIHVAQGRLTGRHSRTLSEQNLMHLWVAVLLSCKLAQVCQLSSDEEDGDRNTKDGLSQEEQQVLLGAVTILALHHLECQEYSPQDQQLDHLQDMCVGSGNCWKRYQVRNSIVAGSSVQRPASGHLAGQHMRLLELLIATCTVKNTV